VILGEVRWVELAPRGGHAQEGRRPAVIVQDQKASTKVPTVLVIPLTSQMDALPFPGTVLLEPDSDNGLRRASVALVFQLTAIDQRYISKQIGNLSRSVLDEMFLVLDELTGRT
jgi:mRNA interferase MazF